MQEEGYVAKLLFPDGAKDVELGAPIAILCENEADIGQFADWSPAGAAPVADAPADSQAQSSAPAQQQQSMVRSSGDRQFASPLAKKTAAANGVDISNIAGTGPNARVVLADVEDALKAGPVKVTKDVSVAKKAAPTAPAKVDMPNEMFQDMELSQIRKVIAERLTHSK
jgi:pyruvate dehydrogenase E2 component (dihydrolipoamide acetyltransferase)